VSADPGRAVLLLGGGGDLGREVVAVNFKSQSGNVANVRTIYKDAERVIGARWGEAPTEADRAELEEVLGARVDCEETVSAGRTEEERTANGHV